MGWADDAQELDDSMLPSYARDGDTGKREAAKEEEEGSSRREAKPKSFAALLGGGAETLEKKNPGDGNENSNANEKNSNGGGGGGGGERGLGGGGKTNGGKKDTSSGKNKSGGKKGKRADPSSNYKQSDLPEDERGLHNDVEVRRRQLQKLNVSKSTRAKDLDTLIACVDLAVPGTGEVKRALKDSIFKPLAPAYTTLIKWIGKSNNCQKALEVFECMGSVHGLEPNTYTCSALLNALGRHRMSEQAWKVYEMMKEKNIECNIYTYTALITAFQKTQEQDKVDQVYSDLKESGIEIDSITYAAMLAALEKSESGSGESAEKAMRVLADMRKSGVEPNQQCFQFLISCCEKAGKADWCFELHADMVKSKHTVDKNVYQSLIAVCGKKGMWQKAIEVYKTIKTKKDLVQPYTNCQNEVLRALAMNGRGLEALALYEDAKKTNKQMTVTPAGFGWIILACERGNMWKKNLDLISKLPPSGLPNKAYMALIGACTRAGKFSQANELFEKQRGVLMSGANMNKPTVDLCNLWATAFRCAQSERGNEDTIENRSKTAVTEKVIDVGDEEQREQGSDGETNSNWFEQKVAKNSVRALWKYAKVHAPKDPLTDEDAEIDEVNFVFPPETSICKAAAAAAAKWGDYELIENIIQIREKSRRAADPMIRGTLVASYANCDKREEANNHLKQMKAMRLTPGFATYAALCAAANRAKDTQDVFAVCEEFTILFKMQNQALVRPVTVPKEFCDALKDTSERLNSWLRALELLKIWNQRPMCGADAKETYKLALKESGVSEEGIASKMAAGDITGGAKSNSAMTTAAATSEAPSNGNTWNTSSNSNSNNNSPSAHQNKGEDSPPLPPAPMSRNMPKPNKIPPLPNVSMTPTPPKKLSANVSAFVPNSSSPKVALKADAAPFVYNPTKKSSSAPANRSEEKKEDSTTDAANPKEDSR